MRKNVQKGKSGMKWVKFRIKTVTDAEDIIISMLYEIGLEGAQIEDKVPLTALEKEQMFVDILPDGPAAVFLVAEHHPFHGAGQGLQALVFPLVFHTLQRLSNPVRQTYILL